MLYERLKQLRKNKNLTQSDLAKLLHVGTSTISGWELGNYFPDLDKIVWLCQFYNVSSDYLLGITNGTYPANTTNIKNTSENSIQYNTITPDKQKLLDYYDRLSEENRDYIRGMMVQLYKEESSNNPNSNAV